MLASLGYFAIIDKRFRLKSDTVPRPLFKFTLHKKELKNQFPKQTVQSLDNEMSNLRAVI